jgi:hypothetical protein
MIVASFGHMGAVAVSCGGQTGSAVSADARFGPGACFAGEVLCRFWCCFGVLLLFAACCGRAAERGRADGCCFS